MQKVSFDTPTSEIIENFCIKPEKQRIYDESLLINAIKEIEETRFLPSERETKSKLIKYAVGEWFSQRIRDKYQELSPEIFELKRTVELKPENITNFIGNKIDYKNPITLEIPMFAKAELGKETEWKKEFTFGEKYNEYRVFLSSKMPHIPSTVRQARKEALTLVYDTYSDALKTNLLSDIIFENPEYAPNPSDSKLMVLWKPKPSEIHVKAERVDRDPAMVLKYDKLYLVSVWKEPDEEPFMNIINACKISYLDKFIEK